MKSLPRYDSDTQISVWIFVSFFSLPHVVFETNECMLSEFSLAAEPIERTIDPRRKHCFGENDRQSSTII